jgi:potassium-dependent mechanosensitive channel
MLAVKRFCVAFIFGVMISGFALPASAQPLLILPTPSDSADPQAMADPVASKRDENAEMLRLAQRKLESGDSSDTAATQDVAHYQSVLAALAQQQAVDQQIKDLEARRSELEEQLKSPLPRDAQVAEGYSFVELDRLKDELAAEIARASLIDDRLVAARVALEKAQGAREECEIKRRQAQEEFDNAKDSPKAPQVASAAKQAAQASNLAAEIVTLRKREVAREQLSQQVQRLAVRINQEQVNRVGPLVALSKADFDEQIAQIKKKEDSANKSLARAQTGLHSVNMQLQEIQQQLETEAGDRTQLTEKLEAHRRSREKLSDEIDSLTQRLQRLAQLRVAWSRRFQTASVQQPAGQDASSEKRDWAELKSWQEETQGVLNELALDLRAEISRMRELRSKITSLTKRAEALNEDPKGLLPWIGMQRSQVEATLRLHETNLGSIETSRRVHEKLLEEISDGVLALTPTNLALSAWHQAGLVWNFEVAAINERPITVRKIVTGAALFVGGWIASRFLSAMFANRLLKRFRLSKDAMAAIRTLVFYVLLAIVALAALRTVNVPLTAFTILGGALAIGVGFGSQALINNFIGGLIMLAERPVRLGERIAFDKYDGVVEDVGFRCTKLRTASDHLVTIPNSTLVNESIENVARRRTIRRQMNVTVTYDTPRKKVAAAVQAIRDLLEEKEIRERIHPIVGFEEFPPRVYFNDYNPESLNIQVTYWYAPVEWWDYMEHCERVNYRIMEEFDRLGVQFAFPSRTVYVVNKEEQAQAKAPARDGSAKHAA